jgi:hypothetical protein
MPDSPLEEVDSLLSLLYTGSCAQTEGLGALLRALRVDRRSLLGSSTDACHETVKGEPSEETELTSSIKINGDIKDEAKDEDEGDFMDYSGSDSDSDLEKKRCSEDDWRPKGRKTSRAKPKQKAKTGKLTNGSNDSVYKGLRSVYEKVFIPYINIELFLKELNEKPNRSIKRMELDGVPIYHYPCKYCNKSIPDIIHYSKHVRKEHPDRESEFEGKYSPYKCFGCERKFLTVKAIRCHIKEEHEDYAEQGYQGKVRTVLVCPYCPKRSQKTLNGRDKEAFLEHIMEHELGQKGLQCSKCPQKFGKIRSLKRHTILNHEFCGVMCPECGEQCVDRKDFISHKRRKHANSVPKDKPEKSGPDEIQICDLCAKQFKSRKSFLDHKLSAHRDPSKLYSCDECGQKFPHKCHLDKHTPLHRPPTVPCEHCGKLFHTDVYLKRHLKTTHTLGSEKPFQCDQCEKGFPDSHQLADHMNMHLGLKPYKCR